jgi:hypothetical protein
VSVHGKPGPRVRMYRQGLGDCFLVTVPRAAGRPLSMLIDCGVLLGTANAEEKMARVARDIAAATGKHLDIVVATHEHWDHLSGFLQAREVFDQMTIGEVWLAWTEDPADSLATQLRQHRQQALRGLRMVAGRLADVDALAAEQLRGPLSFFGAAGSQTTRDALDYLTHHRSQPRIRFHRPGDPALELPEVPQARIYVLGPPRDSKLIHRSNPTKSGHEVYELAQGMALFTAAALSGALDPQEDLGQAFDPRYRVHVEKAGGRSFFQGSYYRSYDAWRRIDTDWLSAAEQLALALDDDTNNTSLALALELEPQGRVLLFPGDAQVGNWLSWDDCRWRSSSGTSRWITAADLLQRTVLYKVGHHGSHNATLREKGLERMVSRDLVALVPVDQEMAQRKRWNMPFPALYERLDQLARGRILRADADIPERPDGISASEWQQFRQRVTADPGGLFYDYAIPAASAASQPMLVPDGP